MQPQEVMAATAAIASCNIHRVNILILEAKLGRGGGFPPTHHPVAIVSMWPAQVLLKVLKTSVGRLMPMP